MENCWKIKSCGREAGGRNVMELGECIASTEGFGHSCWAVAGTLCGGEVQGSVKEKAGNCLTCEVHKAYNRQTGVLRLDVATQCSDENRRYQQALLHR